MVDAVIVLGVFFVLVFMVVQGVMWFMADRAVQAMAQEAAIACSEGVPLTTSSVDSKLASASIHLVNYAVGRTVGVVPVCQVKIDGAAPEIVGGLPAIHFTAAAAYAIQTPAPAKQL